MDDIKCFKEDGKFLISSKKLSVSDFGDTFEEAIKNFEKSAIGMLIHKLTDLDEKDINEIMSTKEKFSEGVHLNHCYQGEYDDYL